MSSWNSASECKPGLFQDADVAGGLTDLKSASGGMFRMFGERTCVPISWASQKQTAVSRCSTEVEVISSDTGLRKEGLTALTLWDSVMDVLELLASRARSDPSRQLKTQTSQTTQGTSGHVPPNAQKSTDRAHVFLFKGQGRCDKEGNKGAESACASCFADASWELGLAS